MSQYKQFKGIPAGYEDDYDDYEEDMDALACGAQSLKITIVPDITTGACLNGGDFNAQLTPDMERWLEVFREMWNSYKSTPVAAHNIKAVLVKDSQPLLLALKMFACCPGSNNLRNKNLALFILETACDLHKQHPNISATCTDNTRMIAFNFIKTCGVIPLYRAVIRTFELHKIRELLEPKLRELMAQGYFKDVAYWVMYLELTHKFGLFDVVFPLILQDKVCLAEDYLNVAKELQLPTVQFLDSLLNKQKTVYEHCDEILAKYKYADVKHNVLSHRPMSKLVTRFVKKYKIDAQLTPHLNFSKACSYMHYLYRKFLNGGMSCDAWRELARDAATTHALQMDVVAHVASYGDLPEAIYWVEQFALPHTECPTNVQNKLQELSQLQGKGQGQGQGDVANAAADAQIPNENEREKAQYLTLCLSNDSIVLVDTQPKFLEMLEYLERQPLIAFDSEWKPSAHNDNVVSLLQLATMSRVFLLDCLAPALSEDLWRKLGQRIFNNLEILKMGFSLQQDVKMLHRSLPLSLDLQATACYLDLRELWRRLKYMQIVSYPYGESGQVGESLCALTELCLGKKLDKSNQCSNWAKRPLRHDQIIYAALDAHCLLQIYEVLTGILDKFGVDIVRLVDEITTSKTGYLIQIKRDRCISQNATGTKQAATGFQESSMSAQSIRFFCDITLSALSKELRKLGIDCIDMTTKCAMSVYIDQAKRENRYVLSRDTEYTYFAAKLSPSQCMQLPPDSSVEQMLNVIAYFNIEVRDCDLFTRCLQCNANRFIFALREDMQLMRFGRVHRLSQPEPSGAAYTRLSPFERRFHLKHINEHILQTRTTSQGKPIRLSRIRPHILYTVEHFFICDTCGTCTWNGAHPLHSSITAMVTNSNKACNASTSSRTITSTATNTATTTTNNNNNNTRKGSSAH